MALGLESAFGNQALSDTIRRILSGRKADALAADTEAYKRSQDAIKNALASRTVGVDEGGLALNRDKFTADAPMRAANVLDTQSQTAARTQNAAFEADDRARKIGNLNLLSDTPTGPGRMSPRAIGNLKTFNDLDFTTPGGERAIVPAAMLGNEEGERSIGSWNSGGSKVFGQQEAIRGAQDRMTAAARQPQVDTADMGKLADMVAGDPDMFAKLDAKTRTAVAMEMARKDIPQANGRQAAVDRMVDEALDTINALETMPGFSAAVGAKGASSLFGLLDEPMAGSAAANFAENVKTLKARISLPRLQLMRGMGALSDREGSRIESASSALDRRLSEGQFKSELAGVKESLLAAKARRGGVSSNSGSTPQIGERRSINGQIGEWDGRGWKAVQ